MGERIFFVDVALPLSVKGTFTYQTEEAEYEQIHIGCRVAVSFGRSKIYTAIVLHKHQDQPNYKSKYILSLLDKEPLITKTQIQFFNWISSYYMCTLGEVIRFALPSGFLLQSDTYIHGLVKIEDVNTEEYSDEVFLILEALETKGTLLISEISDILDGKPYMATLNDMLSDKLIEIEEKASQKYIPKLVKKIEPSAKFLDPSQMPILLEEIKNAPKQREAMLKLYSIFNANGKIPLLISNFKTENSISDATIRSLKEKSFVTITEHQQNRIILTNKETSFDGLSAKNNITNFRHNEVNLIGISSLVLQLEIAKELCEYYLGQKKMCLFVLKDIHKAIRKKNELEQLLPNASIGIFHGKYNTNEKVDFWKSCLTNSFDIIIGTSGVLFLPFQNLGIILLDEEHESGFKNNFQKPYFNARDLSVYLAHTQKISLALFSQTPSIESYTNLKAKKYSSFAIENKEEKQNIPIEIVDLTKFASNKTNDYDLSPKLLEEITQTLKENKQIIIYKDRRGYSMQLECNSCGYIAYCPNCDVSLTYHKNSYLLKCHYCGHNQNLYEKCPSCANIHIKSIGTGIQQIEEKLKITFPDASIARMDSDSMRKKYAYEAVNEDFSNHKIDILIGTKMVLGDWNTKSLALVVILKGDEILHFPNFRAWENAYQTLHTAKQLATEHNAKFLLQTREPQHIVYKYLLEDDYSGFVEFIVNNRKPYHYPPWGKLVLVQLIHKNQEKLLKASQQLGMLLKKGIEKQYILGPEAPSVEKLNREYYQNILIKIPSEQSAAKVKKYIQGSIDYFYTVSSYKSIKIRVDVDPNRV